MAVAPVSSRARTIDQSEFELACTGEVSTAATTRPWKLIMPGTLALTDHANAARQIPIKIRVPAFIPSGLFMVRFSYRVCVSACSVSLQIFAGKCLCACLPIVDGAATAAALSRAASFLRKASVRCWPAIE